MDWESEDTGLGPYGNNTSAMAENIKGNASNIRVGVNPLYLCSDFLAAYPQFGGTSLSVSVTATAGSNQLTVISATGISSGMLVVDLTGNIADGTTILLITENTLTMSSNATTTATLNIILYPMIIPAMIVSMYIGLATSCINQLRWHSYWQIAIGWFVAHFCTLYLQGTTAPGSPAAQVVSAAQARGLMASKGVGDVSVSYDYNSIAQDLDGWASWKLTIFGQQLATVGKLVSKGGMMVR